MKDRIKKFYNDHDKIIIKVTLCVVTGSVVLYSINKIEDQNNIVRVTARMSDTDELLIRIVQKNGKYQNWILPKEVVK